MNDTLVLGKITPLRLPLKKEEDKTPFSSPLTGGKEYSSPDKGRTGGVYIPYLPKLKEYARQNRKNPTAAESRMWSLLSRHQFEELKFTRQKPLDSFIVDFYCSQLLLAIEIDGDTHAYQEKYDVLRSDILKEKYGIEVIRYINNDVLQNTEGVYEELWLRVSERKGYLAQTHPYPPLSGRE